MRKYVQRKAPKIKSKAAAEVKRLMDRQDPALGYAAAASMIGVHAETMRSIVNDSRVPSPGVINGLARVLDLSSKEVNHLLELRKEDVLAAKLRKSVGEDTTSDNFAEVFSVLTKEQRETLMRSALRFAKGSSK